MTAKLTYPMREKVGINLRKEVLTIKGNQYERWIVDLGTWDKIRHKLTFKSEAEQLAYQKEYLRQHEIWMEKQKILQKKIGQDAKKLDNVSLRQTAEALDKLKGAGTIDDAVTFYLEHANPSGGNRTAKEVYDELLTFRKYIKKRRDRTLQDIRCRLGRFITTFGAQQITHITQQDVEKWLHEQGGGILNQHHNKTHVVCFFNFAIKKKYVQVNPAVDVELPEIEDKKPRILSVDDAEKLLRYTENNKPEMIPYMTLCLLAGVRPLECSLLDWSNISLPKKQLFIASDISKTHDERYVDLSNNLIVWLRPYRKKNGLIYFSKKDFRDITKNSGIQWTPDCMRHSFGSYHMARYENAEKTALQMGHRGIDILFVHYRRAVTRKDAAAFWKIRPSQAGAAGQLRKQA